MIKNHRKRISSKIGFFIFYFLFVFGTVSSVSLAQDLLEQSFQQSKQYDTVVDIGNNKNAVGNDVTRGGMTISIGGGGITNSGPLVVRIIRWILRMMAVLGVSMGIYVGIQYVLSQGDAAKEKKAVDNLVKIAVGIVLALSAIAIVNLIQSITRSTL